MTRTQRSPSPLDPFDVPPDELEPLDEYDREELDEDDELDEEDDDDPPE